MLTITNARILAKTIRARSMNLSASDEKIHGADGTQNKVFKRFLSAQNHGIYTAIFLILSLICV
ncbi:hypothetical protein [Dichelobacter nodosus]|nr:hypothetical protein [Dichelobacter nodosus]AXM45147.1 hypothetical protein DYQ38_01145 [Dichelobacter nodosus]